MGKTVSRESSAKSKDRGARARVRLQPFFRRDVVTAKIKKVFPNVPATEILPILDQYQSGSDEQSARVHLDILKVSDGNLGRLRELISAAREDSRDVIMTAENPTILSMGIPAWAVLSDDEKDRVSDKDVEQYLEWVQT